MDQAPRDLLSFVERPPSGPPRDAGWPAVEQRVAFVFPARFKHLVELFGDHSWNRFARLLNPLWAEFDRRLESILGAERTARQEFPRHHLFPLHPEPEGLFPWATTDNGDTLFWIPRGSAMWPTLIKGAREPEFEVNFSSCELILYQIAAGTIRSNVLPDLSGEGR